MEFLILLCLILLNALFVISEIAFISARKSRLEAMAQKGDHKAQRALKLIHHPETFLSTAQIGITLIAILTGVYSGETFSQDVQPVLERIAWLKAYADSLSTGLIVVGVTFLSIILGELIPKKLGLLRAELIARHAAGPMLLVSRLMYPFVWFLSSATSLFFKLLNLRKPSDASVTEEEIKAMITEGSEQGSIEEDEKDIIERVFHLGDRNITSLMTHRTDIVWLDVRDSVETVKRKLDQVVYSTYPACLGDVDEIKGLVYVKDLLKAAPDTPLEKLIKPALFVPENNSAYQLLEKIRSSKIHACFVVNEYGTLEGMVTLNDIVEAIVGEVPQAGQEEYGILKRQDGSYLVDGLIQFYDFLSYFERADWMNEGEQEFDTLAGFVLHRLEHIPVTGEQFTWKEFSFEVVDMDGQRIDKLMVKVSEDLSREMEEKASLS